jgi:hypothetical protein
MCRVYGYWVVNGGDMGARKDLGARKKDLGAGKKDMGAGKYGYL